TSFDDSSDEFNFSLKYAISHGTTQSIIPATCLLWLTLIYFHRQKHTEQSIVTLLRMNKSTFKSTFHLHLSRFASSPLRFGLVCDLHPFQNIGFAHFFLHFRGQRVHGFH